MNGGGGAERLRSDNKCLELDPAASRQWNSIRRAERLATDTDVARLLLSLYRGPGCEDVCLRCSASLPRVCTHCHSHQPLGPSADSDNNPLPVRGSGTQHNRDNNPLPVRGSGTQHNRDNNVSVARTRSGLMLAPSGPEAKKSKRTSDSVGRRTLQVRLKRCDSLLDANGTASITPQAGSLGRKHNTLLGQEGAPVTKTDVDICCVKTNMHSAVLGDSQSRMSSDVSQDTVCLCVKTEFEFIAKAEQNQSNSFDTHMGQDTKCEIVRQEPASEDKKENWALEGTLQAALFSDIIEPESEEISVPQTPTGNADRLSDSKSYLKQNEALKQSKGPTTTNSSSTSTSTSTSTWKDRRQDSSLTFSIHRTESSIAENTLSSSQEHTEQDTNLKLSEGSGVEVSHAEQDENLTPTEGSGVEVSHAEQDANLTPTEGSGVEVSHAEQDANLTSTEGSGVEVSHAEQDANLTPTEGSGVEVSHTEQDANLTPTEGRGVEVSHAEQDANLEHSKSNGFDVSHRRGRSQRGRSQRGAPVSYADCDSESSSSSWGTGHSDVDTDTDMQSTEDEQSPQQSLLACRPDTSQCEQDQLALSHTGQTDAFQAHHKSAQQHLEKKADMAAPHVTDTDREQHVGNSSVVSSPLRESGTSGQAPVIERVSSALNEVTSPLRESGTSGQAPVIEMMSSALNEVTSPLRESGTSGQAPVIEMMSSALNEVTSTEVHQHIQRTKTLLSAPLSKKGKRGQESAIETMKSTVQKGLHTEEQQPVQYLYDTVTPTSLEEIDDTEQQQPVNEGESQSPLPSLQIAAQDPLECEPQATASSQGCQATDERAGKCKSPTVLPTKPSKPRPRKQKAKGSPSHQAKGNEPAASDSYFKKCPKCCVSLRSKEAAYHHISTQALCTQCRAMLTSLCDITKHKQRHAKEDPKTKGCRVRYLCNFCSKTYKEVNISFFEHRKRHLQITGFYISEQEDSQHAAGEETMTSRHGARCEQCGVSCEAEENIDGAKRDVTENTKCRKCRKMCPTCLLCMTKGSDLATHQDTKIVGRCTECNSLHTSLCQIRSHTRTHEHEMEAKKKGLMRYLCNVCDREYMGWKSLRNHRKSHAAERSHRCDQCPKTFYTRDGLNVHLKWHQGLVRPKEKKYQCEVCGKRFVTPSLLEGHLNLHSSQRPFKCDTCGATVTSKHNLLRHKRIHRPLVKQTYQCPQCPASFTSSNSLWIHALRHKPKQDLPYGCSQCGKRFIGKALLVTHMYTHTGEKPYSCQDCGTSFARTSSLAVHRRNEHTDEKPYACDKCDAKFARSDYLRKHSHTHAGKAVLQCRDCKGRFTDKKALNYHVRKHHKAQPLT